jgi:hypothetical protein
MFRGLHRHISYANIVATMALVFAMGGTAIAAKHYLITSTKQIRPSVLKSLTGRAGLKGTTGAQGVPGTPGKEGTAGKEGKEGAQGAAGSAVAYARVEANGTLDTAASRNITSVTLSLITGVYCITPSVPVHNVTVSVPHVGGDTGVFAQANIPSLGDATTSACTTPAWVATFGVTGTLENHPFYLVFN